MDINETEYLSSDEEYITKQVIMEKDVTVVAQAVNYAKETDLGNNLLTPQQQLEMHSNSNVGQLESRKINDRQAIIHTPQTLDPGRSLISNVSNVKAKEMVTDAESDSESDSVCKPKKIVSTKITETGDINSCASAELSEEESIYDDDEESYTIGGDSMSGNANGGEVTKSSSSGCESASDGINGGGSSLGDPTRVVRTVLR